MDDNFFKMMNIPIVQGSFFTERNDSCRQVIIDERGAEKLIRRSLICSERDFFGLVGSSSKEAKTLLQKKSGIDERRFSVFFQ